jgi:hypothetical protein|tara:strand:+ start:1497 stop:1631 length:135 start_codon:yes stop_codon:yes gene_type:complete
MAGLKAVVTECRFDVNEQDISGGRGYVLGQAIVDKRKDFLRQLD